jgi:hypothetical protein
MLSQGESRCGEVLEYAKSLLLERQRELKELELKYCRKQIQADEYLSCSRALLRAISELGSLLPDAPEHVSADRTNPDGSYQSNPTPEPK